MLKPSPLFLLANRVWRMHSFQKTAWLLEGTSQPGGGESGSNQSRAWESDWLSWRALLFLQIRHIQHLEKVLSVICAHILRLMLLEVKYKMTVTESNAFSKIFLTQLKNLKFQAKTHAPWQVYDIFSEFITIFKPFPI